MKSKLYAVTLAACFTLQDVRDAECLTACLREGYTAGDYRAASDSCRCSDLYDRERITRRKAAVLPVMRRSPIHVPVLPTPPEPRPTYSPE